MPIDCAMRRLSTAARMRADIGALEPYHSTAISAAPTAMMKAR